MSRAERRAYKRMTKNQDPYALPGSTAQKARVQRQRSRRPARGSEEFRFVSRRYLAWALGGALAVGLIGFSITWPNMPLAAYVGLIAAAVWIALTWLVRAAQRRAAEQQRSQPR